MSHSEELNKSQKFSIADEPLGNVLELYSIMYANEAMSKCADMNAAFQLMVQRAQVV